jgi:hypothetical protein
VTFPERPSATYRGYRRQALYALWRILTSEVTANYVYAPEGAEDLYVFDENGKLYESVQVKDYAADLTFSDFEPRKANSYFYRVHQRLTQSANSRNILATFGPLGPELRDCLGDVPITEGAEQREIFRAKMDKAAGKLAEYHAEIPREKNDPAPTLSRDECEHLLRAIKVKSVNEAELTDQVIAQIKPMAAGSDPRVAFELLLFWVYLASEYATRLSRQALREKIRQIGVTLAALQSHHQEWHRTIVDLPHDELSSTEKSQLADSYGAGVQATWRHILADVDVRRDARLAEMKEKLSRRNILLVHGASGQGKSSLAYRYLCDFCPESWRFQVSLLSGREHALNVCLALESHATALGIPAHVLVDVAPNDSGWPDLVARLAKNPAIKVIVVIREEDFRRAQFDASSVTLDQIDLDALTEAEARLIYAALAAAGSAHFLSFEDAWAQFGGAGPLMEFTYLLQQGQSLRDKLRQQVELLRREALQSGAAIGTAHLRLLALVATAAEYECRLDTAKACIEVGLSPLLDPVAPFEREYLVRRFSESGAVGGLHAIRSHFLVEHLFWASQEVWLECARSCLRLLLPGDLERFLLCLFSRRPADSSAIVSELVRLPTLTWKQAGGITRSR